MEKLFAYRKMRIMNSPKRSVPNIVMLMLANCMLVKDFQENMNKHESLAKDERNITFTIPVQMKSLIM